MAEEKDQTEASWGDLPLPDEYPKPYTEDTDGLNGEAGEDAPATTTTKESPKDQAAKGYPKLLQMLKAAESRWTPQGRDRDGAEASESETGEPVAEARKTDMVSKDIDPHITFRCICVCTPQEAWICMHLGCQLF